MFAMSPKTPSRGNASCWGVFHDAGILRAWRSHGLPEGWDAKGECFRAWDSGLIGFRAEVT